MTVIPLRRRRLPDVAAFGRCTPLGRRHRLAVPLVLVLLLGAAVGVRASGVLDPGPDDPSIPPLAGAAAVAPGLVRGGRPSDIDLVRLRDAYGVRAVVDVEGMDVEEEAVAGSLGLRTVRLAVADGQPPTAGDLLGLVRLLRTTVAARPGGDGTGVVYLHDRTGSGPVLIVTALLRVLRGDPLPAAVDRLRAESPRRPTEAELRALTEVARVRAGTATGPYAALRDETW